MSAIMQIRPIRTEKDHRAAPAEIEKVRPLERRQATLILRWGLRWPQFTVSANNETDHECERA
jgi:hypothetical protein